MATCYRHPGRETGVSCSNCGRPICPDCMTPTAVGMRCPECAGEKTRVVRARSLSTRPQVTIALIVINVIVFLLEGKSALTISGNATGTLVEKGGLIGSIPGLAGFGVAHGEVWRIVTCGFLHDNLIHIAFNMWVLYIFGSLVEPAIGGLKLAVVYFVSLFASSLVALITTPHNFTIGASGAIFGLMGAAVMILRERHVSVMQSGVGMVIVLNVVISFTLPGISWGGHLGGLAGGLLAMAALQLGDRRRSQLLGYGLCAVLAVLSIGGSIAVANATVEEHPLLLQRTGDVR